MFMFIRVISKKVSLLLIQCTRLFHLKNKVLMWPLSLLCDDHLRVCGQQKQDSLGITGVLRLPAGQAGRLR